MRPEDHTAVQRVDWHAGGGADELTMGVKDVGGTEAAQDLWREEGRELGSCGEGGGGRGREGEEGPYLRAEGL